MLRAGLHRVLLLALATSLVVCPFSCLGFPRVIIGQQRAVAKDHGCTCCHTGASSGQVQRDSGAPESTPPGSKQPCSCLCICKGAIAQSSGLLGRWDAVPSYGEVAALPVVEPPAPVIGTTWPPSHGPPPVHASGRQLRTLLASLLL